MSVALFEEFDRRALPLSNLRPYLDFNGGKPHALRLKDAVLNKRATLSASNVWPAKSVWAIWPHQHFARIVEERAATGSRTDYLWWYRLFIVLGQIQIAAFFTFMVWLLAKFTFWFVTIYKMLPDGKATRTARWQFKPFLNDPQNRYGLGELFTPYNQIVLLIAVGASYVALNLPDGATFNALTQAEGAGSGATRVVHLIVIGAAIAGVLIGPMWLYPRRLRLWAETTRLGELRREIAQTGVGGHKDLLEEHALFTGQTTWPSGDNRFRATIALVFAILLLPLGSALDFLPGSVAEYTRLPQYVRGQCKSFAIWLYHLDDEPGWR